MARISRGFVEYDRVAPRYREGRSLPPDVLDRWARAVAPYLPSGQIRVADLGAGTGVFADAWPAWAPSSVVAIEPSAAMIKAADVRSPNVTFVQGAAEALPLRDKTVDVVWLSTTLHHFADIDRAVGECARVLTASGRVLVRTYAPGRTLVSWAHEFPGRPKWEGRFQTEDELIALFRAQGFAAVEVTDVLEWEESYATSAQWAERMRDADSMLTALTDEEMAQGLEALRANADQVGRLELTLFVFGRP